jgi:plastocyanin
MPPGGIFEYTFDTAGTTDYFCIVHPWMIGSITVE